MAQAGQLSDVLIRNANFSAAWKAAFSAAQDATRSASLRADSQAGLENRLLKPVLINAESGTLM
jgi:hypothetical protein